MSLELVKRNIENDLVVNIGKKIRKLRKENKLTLKQLSVESGVSSGTISKIEKGEMVPSIVIFLRIVKALGKDLGYFLDVEEPLVEKEYQYFSKEDYKTLKDKEHGLSFRLYGPNINSRTINGVFYCKCLYKDSGSGSNVLVHKEEELLLCTKGRIKFKAAGDEIILTEGSILFLKSNVPHSWENYNNGESELFLVTLGEKKGEADLPLLF
jgi:transcriptional regulator with XRE-family HTH domain